VGKRRRNETEKVIRIQGWDLSLNHAGFVELVDGKLDRFWYVSDRVGCAKRSKTGTLIKIKKCGDWMQDSIDRILFWRKYLVEHAVKTCPDFIGIEDYALEGGAHGAHYKGELGGIARLAALDVGARVRLHDPGSVKLYTAHRGNADKAWIEAAVKERWGADFSQFNLPPQPGKKEKRETSEDLADAFSIAQLVWAEVQLRRGTLELSSLHEKEIQVFNRATKAYPVNILGREWITRRPV
jgi:Holliday junction resolvasome RuvABC endonuclease subunit